MADMENISYHKWATTIVITNSAVLRTQEVRLQSLLTIPLPN